MRPGAATVPQTSRDSAGGKAVSGPSDSMTKLPASMAKRSSWRVHVVEYSMTSSSDVSYSADVSEYSGMNPM